MGEATNPLHFQANITKVKKKDLRNKFVQLSPKAKERRLLELSEEEQQEFAQVPREVRDRAAQDIERAIRATRRASRSGGRRARSSSARA